MTVKEVTLTEKYVVATKAGLNSLGILLVLLFSVVGTYIYMSQTQWFYCWDAAYYLSECISHVKSYRSSFSEGWQKLADSMGSDYPAIYVQPLVPLMLLFGGSRLVFETGISLFYQVPFFLVMGGMAATLIGRNSPRIFWPSVMLVFFMPRIWAVTFRGYPDIGALSLYVLAIWLYLKDMRLGNWRYIAAIGLCLGLAVLFRRHYAYDVVAFFIAAMIAAVAAPLSSWISSPSKACWIAVKNIWRVSLIGAVSVCVLLTIGISFVRHVMGMNTLTLYVSYAAPSLDIVKYQIQNVGWLTVVVSIMGYVTGFLTFKTARPTIVFVVCLAVLIMCIWIFLVPYPGLHYTLHFAPYIYLGVLLAFWAGWFSLQPKWRVPVYVIVGVLVAVNFVVGFAPFPWLDRQGFVRSLFALSSPPSKRSDYNEVVRLVDYLRQISQPTDVIHVVGSSALMNDDLLRNAEPQLYGDENTRLNIGWVPHVDSRDFYPLENLLFANYVVLTQPFKNHLHPAQQRVARVAGDIFVHNWDLAKDFQLLPEEFELAKGVSVRIYKRIRPTSMEIALQTLDRMVAYVGMRPGSQPDWVVLTGPFPPLHSVFPLVEYVHIGFLEKQPPAATLTYLNSVPSHGVVQGNFTFRDTRCVGGRLFLSVMGPDGKITRYAEELFPVSTESHKFNFPFTAPQNSRLLLTLATIDEKDPSLHCGSICLDDLQVVSKDGSVRH